MTTSSSSSDPPDIEDLHRVALSQGSKAYEDPTSGFSVFTELFHLQRGKCCGSKCRHCPYGWENVAREDIRRPAQAKSGDRATIQLRLQEIDEMKKKNEKRGGSAKKRLGGTHGGRLTDKNVPYTKKGDQGFSQLLTGERRSKNDQAFEAMGTVDELCSVVGVAHAQLMDQLGKSGETPRNNGDSPKVLDYGDLPEWLVHVMSRLFDSGSHVAKPVHRDDEDEGDDQSVLFEADGVGGGLDIQHVEALEDWTDTMTESLPELRNFILPTGSVSAAQFHVSRTVCRRAERTVVPLVEQGVCDPNVLKYLNRLSDFLFVAARWCNYCQGTTEIEYRKAERRDKQRVPQVREGWKK